mgnify:CR=1 FL=1
MGEGMSFTQKYFLYLIALEFGVVIFLCAMVYITMDITPINWVIGAIGAEIAAYSAGYIWKSKCENRSKYAQLFVAEVADKYGIDMAIKIAEIVLKD